MRFLVTNIPVNSWVTGVVTVPDGTPPEKLQDAIRGALLEAGYVPVGRNPRGGNDADPELDRGILKGGWELVFTEWRF
jgi:hypothetical protein